jgi:hypothetical protein
MKRPDSLSTQSEFNAFAALEEADAGVQESLFDAEGERFPDRKIKLYAYQPKFPILIVKPSPWGYSGNLPEFVP